VSNKSVYPSKPRLWSHPIVHSPLTLKRPDYKIFGISLRPYSTSRHLRVTTLPAATVQSCELVYHTHGRGGGGCATRGALMKSGQAADGTLQGVRGLASGGRVFDSRLGLVGWVGYIDGQISERFSTYPFTRLCKCTRLHVFHPTTDLTIYLPTCLPTCTFLFLYLSIKKTNSAALVRKRTIPTERPPLVGEVSANLKRIEDVAWSAQRIPTAVNLGFLDRSRYFPFK
jgi:hypothetical protein